MAKTDRSPKKIAGLKLPKEIRQAPLIRSLLATSAGRKILDEALLEGAAVAAARVMAATKLAKAKSPKPTKAGKAKDKARGKRPLPSAGAAPVNDVAPVLPKATPKPKAKTPLPASEPPLEPMEPAPQPGAES